MAGWKNPAAAAAAATDDGVVVAAAAVVVAAAGEAAGGFSMKVKLAAAAEFSSGVRGGVNRPCSEEREDKLVRRF